MIQPCWKCGGTGKVYNLNLTNYETPCLICGGTGHLDDAVFYPHQNTENKLPPIGLKPRYVCDSQRLEEILGMFDRFLSARHPIKVEWVEEYNEICKRIKENDG